MLLRFASLHALRVVAQVMRFPVESHTVRLVDRLEPKSTRLDAAPTGAAVDGLVQATHGSNKRGIGNRARPAR